LPSPPLPGDKDPFYQFVPISEVYGRPEEYDKAFLRQVLGNKCIQMRAVALVDTALSPVAAPDPFGPLVSDLSKGRPPGSAAEAKKRQPSVSGSGSAAGQEGGHRLQFRTVVKTYYFHFSRYMGRGGGHGGGGRSGRAGESSSEHETTTPSIFPMRRSLEPSRVGYDQMSHFGTLPYEALFQGYFITLGAARCVGALPSWWPPFLSCMPLPPPLTNISLLPFGAS
jgi:hypothetical protein